MKQSRWNRALASLLLALVVPALAHAHSYMVSPAPRAVMTVRQGNPPCGGDARGSSPTVHTPGGTLMVQFQEVQNHGDFEIHFSPANDTNFTLLASITNPPGGANTAMVTLPSMPCTDCTLQLLQKNGGNVNTWYYSCADVRLMAASSTTTTTTAPAGSSTSTTTTSPAPVDPCEDLSGFDATECELDAALDDPLCDDEIVDPALHDQVVAALRKVESLVQLARTKPKPVQQARLLRKADKKLARATIKAARAANTRRITDSCEGSIGLLVDDLRTGLQTLLGSL